VHAPSSTGQKRAGHPRSQSAQVPRQLKRTLAYRRQSILIKLRAEEKKVLRARKTGLGEDSVKLLRGPVVVYEQQLKEVEDQAKA
jgi:hypothetical protein